MPIILPTRRATGHYEIYPQGRPSEYAKANGDQRVVTELLDLQQSHNALKARSRELEDEQRVASAKYARLKKEYDRVEEQNRTLLEARAAAAPESVHFQRQRDDLLLIRALKGRVAELEGVHEQYQQDLRLSRVKELEVELRTYYDIARQLSKLLTEADHDRPTAELRTQLASLRLEISETNSRLDEAEETASENAKLKAEVGALRAEIRAMQAVRPADR